MGEAAWKSWRMSSDSLGKDIGMFFEWVLGYVWDLGGKNFGMLLEDFFDCGDVLNGFVFFFLVVMSIIWGNWVGSPVKDPGGELPVLGPKDRLRSLPFWLLTTPNIRIPRRRPFFGCWFLGFFFLGVFWHGGFEAKSLATKRLLRLSGQAGHPRKTKRLAPPTHHQQKRKTELLK